MPFNSPFFLAVFLPLVIIGHRFLAGRSGESALAWLVGASLVFYAAWDIAFLPVLLGSILGNHLIGRQLGPGKRHGYRWLVLGIAGNLLLLGYFKYTNFLLDITSQAGGWAIDWPRVVLPIGISFFTFQQIAFLVDLRQGKTQERSLLRHALFIAFFPQLVAGPIVHHKEMMPQFGRKRADRMRDLAEGLTLFTIGLAKKVLIADSMAIPASAIFDGAADGAAPSLIESWFGAVAYGLQIYFDFSAYSDMAVGLGRVFGIDLPINFVAPYRATSIIDFWRRWHITLSRFLRDYLYVPLGGNRRGPWRQRANLMATMLLGGLWHGAGWTFILWGALHGLYLLVNHAWAATRLAGALGRHIWWRGMAWALTFIAVIIAWVPFRAADLATTLALWQGMLGLNGFWHETVWGFPEATSRKLVATLAIAWLAPTAYTILAQARLGLPSKGYPATVTRPIPWLDRLLWSPWHALAMGCLAAALLVGLNDISAFIYYQF